MPDQDGQLYIRFLKDGDKEAFRELYEKYSKSLTVFVYGMVQNMADAEELMMDTFAILASGTARYKPRDDSSFKTWMYTIAGNQARMRLRRHKPTVELNEEFIPGELPEIAQEGPEELKLADERNKALYRALDKIAPNYRQALYLMYFEDMKPAEIAGVMRKTVRQIYDLTARGKAALKEELSRMGY